jgi:DNA mismatch repair protein MutS
MENNTNNNDSNIKSSASLAGRTIFPENWKELVRAGPQIFQLYLQYLYDNQVKYGPRTVVFMQVGMFHEMYGVENEYMNIGLVSQMAHDLNIQMTRRKKSVIMNSPKNYLMAGFPSVHLDRYINILVEDGWTVVIVDQIENTNLLSNKELKTIEIEEDEDDEPNADDESGVDDTESGTEAEIGIGIGIGKDKSKTKAKAKTQLKSTTSSSKAKKIVSRAITRVASPSTFVERTMKADNNFLVSLYLREDNYVHKKPGQKLNLVGINGTSILSAGCAAVDLTTGENYCYEVYSNIEDMGLAIDEAFRFICTFQPRELIINSDNLKKYQESDLISKLELHSIPHQIRLNQVPSEYSKISYQNALLKKCFPEHGALSPLEYLDLEIKSLAGLSYTLMLQYTYEHNEKLITGLPKPVVLDSPENYFQLDGSKNNNNNRKSKNLILANNTIHQLNLIPEPGVTANSNANDISKVFRSVFSVINKTSTAMGARLLRHKLLNPITNVEALEQHYAQIDELRKPLAVQNNSTNGDNGRSANSAETESGWKVVEKHLKIKDIERMNRKINLNSIQPMEWIELDQDLVRINGLIGMLKEQKLLSAFLSEKENANLVSDLNEFQVYYKSVLDLNVAAQYLLDSVTDNFFKPKFDKELDTLGYRIKHFEQFFKTLTRSLSNLITPGSDYITMKRADNSYLLLITKTRFSQLKAKFTKPLTFLIDDTSYTIMPDDLLETPVSKKSSNLNVQIQTLTRMSLELAGIHEELRLRVLEKYFEFLLTVRQRFGTVLERLSRFVARIDVLKSIAKVADEYNYCRPKIVSSEKGNASFMMAVNLRHPLIERINTSVKYVPHSFCLGKVPDSLNKNLNVQDGMIIYGINSSGKSSLMKSAGINLILAQAGFFVAATSFAYYPYHQVLTRIVGDDNLFKGQSSFEVEMIELRGILSRARDSSSLVLGDEISRGTESTSGVSIVASAITVLAKRGVSFIFASHLHQLSSMDRITSLPNVKSYHLHVAYDEKQDLLIYDRNLCEGSGDAIYGLEVVKSLKMDDEFTELALEIRREIIGVPTTLISSKQSKYNADLFMTQCQICQGPAEDTHHLSEQRLADDRGFIDHYHKNVLANLVVLCKKCHLAAHGCNRNSPCTTLHISLKSEEKAQKYLQINGYVETSKGQVLDYKWIEQDINPVPDITSVKDKEVKRPPKKILPKPPKMSEKVI